MPRRRLTYDQAQQNGSLAANKGRFEDRKTAPPTIGKVGGPPKYFNKDQAKVWKELVKMIPSGVAGAADRATVEMAARLLYQFRTDPGMSSMKMALLSQVQSKLGLDPQARLKLMPGGNGGKPQTPDGWSDLDPLPSAHTGTRVM